MLSLEEKKSKCEQFIRSKHFGTHTWITVYLFGVNVQNIVSTIELYSVLIRRFDEGNIPNTFNSSQRLRIKQHILLDIITKVQILIESTVVLMNSLSLGYHRVAKMMTFYDLKQLKNMLNKTKRREFNLRKALGLPKVCDLPLTREERKILAKIYAECESGIWEMLDKMIAFHDKFRILYGKSKHGLIFQSGAGYEAGAETPPFENSALIVYDRKSSKDMPNGYFTARPDNNDAAGWFSVVSHIKFGQQLIDEIFTMAMLLKELAPYICENHKLYAMNCGESYLPILRNGNTVNISFLHGPKMDWSKFDKTFTEISSKILAGMNVAGANLYISSNYTNEKLVESLRTNTVTNIWFNSFPSKTSAES